MTVKEISKIWYEEKKKQVKISTISTYLLLVDNHILPKFGNKTEVYEEDVQDWVYEKINGGISKKMMIDIMICLKMILKFGAKRKLIQFEGFDITYPTSCSEKTNLEVLSKNDCKKLTDYLIDNVNFRNIGILIAIHTGMRIGEICALRWSDLDVEQGIFTVRNTIQRIYIYDELVGKKRTFLIENSPKTSNSYREIPMSKILLKILKPLKKIFDKDCYVLTNECKPTEPRVYRNYYITLLSKLKIQRLKFHGLRHTFATYCIEGGADIKTTSVLLGHSNVGITMNIYVHPNKEQKRHVIDKIFK